MMRRPQEPELSEGMRLLDRYTILDRVGSGGMATIYRAHDDRLSRVVCVKLLRTTLVDGSGSTGGRAVYQATYSHFLQEAIALSKLQHPNTLRIYDFGYVGESGGEAGTSGGAPFHVSEYLDGGNVETYLRTRGNLSPEETLEILEAITGAVAEAHEHGIIHRDIKPSNILFARVRGELVPKLADFGIAHSDVKKSGRDDLGDSVSTVALFSPRWAAPEQLCGSPEGPRTDVYALGLLVAFMLTGRALFDDEDVRTTFTDRVRGDTLVVARLAQSGIAVETARVLARSLLARPDDRIATAPELLDQLRLVLGRRRDEASSPVVAAPTPAPAPATAPNPGAAAGHARAGRRSLTVQVSGDAKERGAQPEPERVQEHGERTVRIVQVHEKIDLSFSDADGAHVRFRVTMLPGPVPKLNVKGLSCFVGRPGQRPTPALALSADRDATGTLELVSSTRQTLGELTWSFGQPGSGGHLFVVDGRHLLIPYSEAQQAVALMLSNGSDIVVMCRR